jgi:hypothetical protein
VQLPQYTSSLALEKISQQSQTSRKFLRIFAEALGHEKLAIPA